MFWDTIPGLIATWAAAVIGLSVILKAAWKATRWGRQLIQGVDRIIDIGATAVWPNGATSLAESMNEIYRRQSETHDLSQAIREDVAEVGNKLEKYIVAHRADHGLTPPEPGFG